MAHKHEILREQLRRLALEDVGPGGMLPGERQLEEMFSVSRITVRRALADLTAEGLLVRVHGKGTFVSHGLVQSRLHLASFHEDMRAAGQVPSTRVLRAGRGEPPQEAAEFLGLEPGAPGVVVERLRLGNGAPVSIDQSWFCLSLEQPLLAADLEGSLYGILAGLGQPVLAADQVVGAEVVSGAAAATLDVPDGAPVLVFRRRSLTRAAQELVPVEYSVSTYRSDRYQLRMRVESPRLPDQED